MSCMICGLQKEFAVWVDCDGEKIGVCHPCREVALKAFKKMQDEFPLECVRHLAQSTCHCQCNAIHVGNNYHWESCMVGKAQKYLGIKVTFKESEAKG